jgi:hypothetical protein
MKLPQSRETFYKVLMAAHRDLVAFSTNDPSGGKPWVRRGRYRAFFAFVEAVMFATKRLILEGHEAQLLELTHAEQILLLERYYDLKDSGAIRESRRFLSFTSNFRFTFELFNRVYRTGFEIPYGHAGWEALLDASKVRDRITHPKRAQDFDITEAEVKLLRRAEAWFWRLSMRILKTLNRPEFYTRKRLTASGSNMASS